MRGYKPQEKIWLSLKVKKNTWCYGLARYSDGSIRIVENLMKTGFATVGNNGEDPSSEYFMAHRLHKGERDMIIQDLYRACKFELEKKGYDLTEKNND